MNAHVPIIEAKRSGEWNVALPGKLSAAVKSFDFAKSSANKAICGLGLNYRVDGFLVDADSTTIGRRDWVSPGTVFLLIDYKAKDGTQDVLTESFPILVKFVLKDDEIKINDIVADVSSFNR
jgi:hypothetical protein